MGNEKPWEQVPESTIVRPEELKNLQWEELAKALQKTPISELKKVVPNFTVEQLIIVVGQVSPDNIREVFEWLPSEKRKALISANQVRMDQQEAARLEKELRLLEQNEALETQINMLDRQMAESERTIQKLSEQKVAWDLWTDFNESLDATIQAEHEMLVEYQRVRGLNFWLINNPNYTWVIQPNYDIYIRHREAIGQLIHNAEEQAKTGSKAAKTVHGIFKEIWKWIVAVESGWNKVAVAAYSAAMDSVVWIWDIANWDKTVGEVLSTIGVSFSADLAAGYIPKLPFMKWFTEKLTQEYWKTMAEFMIQKVWSSAIKVLTKTGSKVIKAELVWDEMEKDLPRDTPPEVRQKMKAEVFNIDLASVAKELAIEITKSSIPGGRGVVGVSVWWTGKAIEPQVVNYILGQ